MKFNPNMAWWIVLVAFLVFLIGAIVTGDKDGVSFHDSALVLQSGLAVFMLSILAGAWGPTG